MKTPLNWEDEEIRELCLSSGSEKAGSFEGCRPWNDSVPVTSHPASCMLRPLAQYETRHGGWKLLVRQNKVEYFHRFWLKKKSLLQNLFDA